jgi:hypothetical protein
MSALTFETRSLWLRRLSVCALILVLAFPLKKVVKIVFGNAVVSKFPKQKAVSVAEVNLTRPQSNLSIELAPSIDAPRSSVIGTYLIFRYDSVCTEIPTPPPRLASIA